jgi:adenylate cyclase
LPRTSATLIAIAGFLVLINIFSGLHEIWFHWAVAPLLLIAVLRAAFSRKSAQ